MILLSDPREDEILYSVIARTIDSLAGVSRHKFLNDLYGFKQISPSVHLPINLSRLLGRIQPWSGLSTLEIIQNLTLYPYYAAFASENQKKNTIDKMNVGKNNPEIGGIGLYLRSSEAKRFFCFCPLCFKQDQLTYGEAHYRRQHQIPSTWVCQVHEVPLLETQVRMRSFGFQKSFGKIVSLEEAQEKAKVPDWLIDLNASQLMMLNKISQAGDWLLKNAVPTRSSASLKEQYQYYLKLNHYIDDKAQFRVSEIEVALEEMFSVRALKAMGFQLSTNSTNGWHLVVSGRLGNDKRYPTLHHLLLITFFGMTPESFLNEIRPLGLPAALFGPPPYLCANKFCRYYMQNVIFKKPETSKGRITHTFICPHCEYSYELAPNMPIDTAQAVSYGYVWDNEIKRVAYDGTISRNEASKRLDITPGVLTNAAKRLGITQWMAASQKNNPLNNEPWEKQKLDRAEALERNRSRFLEFSGSNPGLTRSQIKEHIWSTSLYLARYDREWYEEHAPPIANRYRKLIEIKT